MNINQGAEKFYNTPAALLIDVRGEEEYAAGHIPGSVNIPLNSLASADIDGEKLLFVYCKSGKRSARACAFLQSQGYVCENIGGFDDYTGEVERR